MTSGTAGTILEMIRKQSRHPREKGDSFERLWMGIMEQSPEFEVEQQWQWRDYPDRGSHSHSDEGIDIVTLLKNGKKVAIQCKCYNENDYVNREEINSFLTVSDKFDMRWIVATCKWGRNAEQVIEGRTIPVKRIDFHDYDDVIINQPKTEKPKRIPLPLQESAIKAVVTRLSDGEDRGQLIMACGTGKTFTSLRIAEQLVGGGGSRNILFLAPSIALVSQARREWLRHSTRVINSLVICSDKTSGGRGESDDIMVTEMICDVTTNPEIISNHMKGIGINVLFCTYQSLVNVSKAQLEGGAPSFDMMIADEAHRTTGVERDNGFHMLHDDSKIKAEKRLYMTATPRVYTPKSKRMLEKKGYLVHDMDDHEKFGEVLHRLTFKDAVSNEMLSDYRVTIMRVRDDSVIHDFYDKYLLETNDEKDRVIEYEDVERLVGTALAINGITGENSKNERLKKVLGFANSRRRSKAFCDLLNMPDLHDIVKKRLQNSPIPHRVVHIDGKSSALERNKALRELERADEKNPQMIMNVKLFTEGVDVPSLSAAVFLEPKGSMVDIIQAVGRVMRKSDGKQFGHIIIPVPILNTDDVAGELEAKDGWTSVGRVLQALQSHNERLPDDPLRFVNIVDSGDPKFSSSPNITGIQDKLELGELSEKFYAKIVSSSGLAKPGQRVTDEITHAVTLSGRAFQKRGLGEKLADILGLSINDGTGSANVCKIAALLVINACLLHRRLQGNIPGIQTLGSINGSCEPRERLQESWRVILERDFAPVFEPALSVLESLPVQDREIRNALYRIIDSADAMADSLNDLGYDHAGPLYHKILGTAKSDSAYYTKNVSALMLARLAFNESFMDWSDKDKVTSLRVMDPACGTGTLLMAALKTIKERANDDSLHGKLVEDSICGLDINRHAVQLAACNLTLGAPTVNYKRMNLFTMRHGPQPDKSVKAGSVEILRSVSDRDVLRAFVQPLRDVSDVGAQQVDNGMESFQIQNLDVVIMNPPFGNSGVRGKKFNNDVVKMMQRNELDIKDDLSRRDPDAGNVIDSNGMTTFFVPLVDRLINRSVGTLATVLPTTVCIGASGSSQRRLLANRFHVERIITTHDPKHVNFSYATDINESLMVCRRFNGDEKPPTEFISLSKMPENTKEAVEVADAIANGNYGSVCYWPSERMMNGDWSPAQWYDVEIPEIIYELEKSPLLERIGSSYNIGPVGQGIRGTYEECEQGEHGAVKLFYYINVDIRKTIRGNPDSWRRPKQGMESAAQRYWKQRGHLLLATRFRTTSSRIFALYTDQPSIGSAWIPAGVKDEFTAKALAIWLNSTPVLMMLLNRRSKTLTYPAWSLVHQREILIPKPDNQYWNTLYDTYEKICDREVLPLKQATVCPVRKMIDDAAAIVLGIEPEVIECWRERLNREPTISNKSVESTI